MSSASCISSLARTAASRAARSASLADRPSTTRSAGASGLAPSSRANNKNSSRLAKSRENPGPDAVPLHLVSISLVSGGPAATLEGGPLGPSRVISSWGSTPTPSPGHPEKEAKAVSNVARAGAPLARGKKFKAHQTSPRPSASEPRGPPAVPLVPAPGARWTSLPRFDQPARGLAAPQQAWNRPSPLWRFPGPPKASCWVPPVWGFGCGRQVQLQSVLQGRAEDAALAKENENHLCGRFDPEKNHLRSSRPPKTPDQDGEPASSSAPARGGGMHSDVCSEPGDAGRLVVARGLAALEPGGFPAVTTEGTAPVAPAAGRGISTSS